MSAGCPPTILLLAVTAAGTVTAVEAREGSAEGGGAAGGRHIDGH